MFQTQFWSLLRH